MSEDDDGVALSSVSHPLNITNDMVWAGLAAVRAWDNTEAADLRLKADVSLADLVRAVYTAMAEAQPMWDIDPDSLVEEEIEFVEFDPELDDATVEKFAIRCALGNNGGEWKTAPDGTSHYTDEQKDVWRQFVRDIVSAIVLSAEPTNYGKPSMPGGDNGPERTDPTA